MSLEKSLRPQEIPSLGLGIHALSPEQILANSHAGVIGRGFIPISAAEGKAIIRCAHDPAYQKNGKPLYTKIAQVVHVELHLTKDPRSCNGIKNYLAKNRDPAN